MDINALKLFCDIVETEAMTRAAQRNDISQSAVSQRIRIIEQDFGQVLVERGKGKGKVFITDAGRILYDGAKQIVSEYKEIDSRMRGLSDDIAGIVRVATVYSVGLHLLPARLKPFLKTRPRVNVQLQYNLTNRVYADVLASAIDVGIVACPTTKTGIEIIPFASENMVIVASPDHPFAKREIVNLKELSTYPFVTFSDDIPTRHLIDTKLWQAGARVEILNKYDNIETIKNIVEIGNGLSILPESSVELEVREGTLKVIPVVPKEQFVRPTAIILKMNRTRRAAVVEFVEAIREQSN